MKIIRIVVLLLLSTMLIVSAACASAGAEVENTDSAPVEEQNQVIIVNGNGNIEASNEIMLSFEIGGKLEKIYVTEGQEINTGGIIAELNKDSLELTLNNAQASYNSARTVHIQAKMAVNQNKVALDNAEIAVTKAETTLRTAMYDLEQARELFSWSEISAAEGEIADAEEFLENALLKLAQTPPGTESEKSWQKAVYYAQQRLNTAKSRFDAMLSGTDTEEALIKQQQVDTAARSLEAARLSLETARNSLELSIESEELAKESVSLAKEAVRIANVQLEKAVIVAPFDGTVASLNVEEKSIVSPSTIIVHLVDMDSLELSVEVDEIDVPHVGPGQKATITVDALPALSLNGTVRSVGLLPAQATGLIMYEVKISVEDAAKHGLKIGMSAVADITMSE